MKFLSKNVGDCENAPLQKAVWQAQKGRERGFGSVEHAPSLGTCNLNYYRTKQQLSVFLPDSNVCTTSQRVSLGGIPVVCILTE